MRDINEKMSKHSVVVDGGSGILINPCGGEFSYIITALHVTENIKGSRICKNHTDICVRDNEGTSILISRAIPHPDKDLALLITSEKYNLDLIPSISSVTREDKIYYCGYPDVRRNTINKGVNNLREFEGIVQESSESEFIVRLAESPSRDEVVGASGGGIFKQVENDVFLCGIEYKMDGNTQREFHGRVVCFHISELNTWLEELTLPLIYPALMLNFLDLISKAFIYSEHVDIPENTSFLEQTLRTYIAEINNKNTATPIEVYQKLKESLLINNSDPHELYDMNLWVAFLEFITISALIDNVGSIDISYINEISNKRRFLFSASKGNWTRRLMDIYTSDFRGLMKDGVIIVSTKEYIGKFQPVDSYRQTILRDIGRKGHSHMMVDSAIKNPVSDFKLFHLSGLHHRCVIEKEDIYANYFSGNIGFDDNEVLEKVKGEYSAFIGD
ncbi:trypsin-like peptidase domain-containing protein [Yersinia enterocolitica]|nr:trypsin-like peptidase domain-containing protein [Yersinia enterocolitica]